MSDEYDGGLRVFRAEEKADAINPVHYAAGSPYECIRVIEAWGLDRNHYLATAVKYICRAGKKDDELTDIRKAIWYLQRHADRLEKREFEVVAGAD